VSQGGGRYPVSKGLYDGTPKDIVVDENGHQIISGLETVSVGRFGDLNTQNKTSQFNFKPTWGISTMRYTTTVTGVGAAVGETSGEFRLQSGTAINTVAQIQTNQRGQYQAGTEGQAGIGVRIPTAPTGTQYAEWGYTDFTNGYWFGYDATGLYIAYATGGSVTKTYQTAWNGDRLDGSDGENNPSGLTLDLAKGYVSQIPFVWYGYGDIEFDYYIQPSAGDQIRKYNVHRIKIDNSASIVDPNQPLSFRVGNGASSTTNFSLYIGGHQFSVIDGLSVPQKRTTAELLTNYTTATSTSWQPLIAVRKKAQLNGRTNSVTVRTNHYTLCADSEMETRMTINGVTSAPVAWSTPTGWTSTETALETKITTSGTAMTASTDGEPFAYNFASSTKTALVSVTSESSIPMGATTEIILWIRRLTAVGAMKVLHASIEFDEEW